ncbi:MAG: proline dehydrogenase family protein, partial [Thiobacillaceae bacterium]
MDSRDEPGQRREALILQTGKRLAHRLGGRRPGLYGSGGLRGRLLARALDDTNLRTRLFRFIDVLPQLADSRAVAGHFRAYLNDCELGGLWGRVLRLGEQPWSAFAVRRSVQRLARQFLAEETSATLARLMDELRPLPARVSLDAVGEAVLSEAEANVYRDRVLRLIDSLAGASNADVSIKLSALTPRFDPIDPEGSAARVWTRLHPIAGAAQARGVGLTVDMEQTELKPLTQAIFLQLPLRYPDSAFRTGIALQAYLKDATPDLEMLLAFAREHQRRVAVRLVKGAYWDAEQA